MSHSVKKVDVKEFDALITGGQGELYNFIMVLSGNSEHAREIVQETNLALMRKAEQYDPAYPFITWARSIAYYEVLTFRQKRRRERLVFNDEVFDRVSARTVSGAGEESFSTRRQALEVCLKKLTESQRSVIDKRYYKRVSVIKLSRELGCSEAAVSTMLYRIRKSLAQCIAKLLAQEAVL